MEHKKALSMASQESQLESSNLLTQVASLMPPSCGIHYNFRHSPSPNTHSLGKDLIFKRNLQSKGKKAKASIGWAVQAEVCKSRPCQYSTCG